MHKHSAHICVYISFQDKKLSASTNTSSGIELMSLTSNVFSCACGKQMRTSCTAYCWSEQNINTCSYIGTMNTRVLTETTAIKLPYAGIVSRAGPLSRRAEISDGCCSTTRAAISPPWIRPCVLDQHTSVYIYMASAYGVLGSNEIHAFYQ